MHCLDKYQMGVHIKLVFKGQLYSTTFADFIKAIRDVCKDKYHGPQTPQSSSDHREGRNVSYNILCSIFVIHTFVRAAISRPSSVQQFRAILD